MKIIAKSLFVLFFLLATVSNAQDTLSIYFSFGSAKITNPEKEKLEHVRIDYDLSNCDSIHFIGMADSVGRLKSNLKLSAKRAKNVFKYCEKLFLDSGFYKVKALGEKQQRIAKKNRRVDVVLFFDPLDIPEQTEENKNELLDGCFNIQYSLLHRAHVREVSKNGRTNVIIEPSVYFQINNPDFFYRRKKNSEFRPMYYGTLGENGELISKKIKWKKRDHVAIISKEDFNRFKIFTIDEPPCKECDENFNVEQKISNEAECLQVDRFLMENVQFKNILFNSRFIKIRVPREYVNLKDTYFLGCNLETELDWEKKERGRKKRYYFAKIPRYAHRTENITRVMECCASNPEPSECDKTCIRIIDKFFVDRSYYLDGEIGSYFAYSEFTPYAVIGMTKQTYVSRFSLWLGTDRDLGFLSMIRYQYHFLSFNPIIFSSWQSPSTFPAITRYGRFYLGTEIRTNLESEGNINIDQNLHLGLAFVSEESLIPRVFFQYGLAKEYGTNESSNVYATWQVGVNIHLIRLNTK